MQDGGEAEQQQAKGAAGKVRSRGRARPRGGGGTGRGASKAGDGDKGDEEADEAEPAAGATVSKPTRGRRERGGGAKDGAPAGGTPGGAAAQQDGGGAKRAGGQGGTPREGKAAPDNKPLIIGARLYGLVLVTRACGSPCKAMQHKCWADVHAACQTPWYLRPPVLHASSSLSLTPPHLRTLHSLTDPQSEEYKVLDLAGKQAAFQAAAKVFSSTMQAAADAGQV